MDKAPLYGAGESGFESQYGVSKLLFILTFAECKPYSNDYRMFTYLFAG